MPFCSNCGKEVGTFQFCPNCGKPQGKTEPFLGDHSSEIPSNQNNSYNDNTGSTKKPTGLTLLVIYEVLLGVLIILGGLVFFSYVIQIPLLVMLFIIVLAISILWGSLGIIAGLLMNRWDNAGYTLSYIFLISTGILLFFQIFPIIAMIVFIYYLRTNTNFKNTFNAMRH